MKYEFKSFRFYFCYYIVCLCTSGAILKRLKSGVQSRLPFTTKKKKQISRHTPTPYNKPTFSYCDLPTEIRTGLTNSILHINNHLHVASLQRMDVTVWPGDHCPCELNEQNLYQAVIEVPPGRQYTCKIINDGRQQGTIKIGNANSSPLTAGEEYFITIRTYSYFGVGGRPKYIVVSLPVDDVVANNRVEGALAKFDIEVASGTGSFMFLRLIENGSIFEQALLPFRYQKLQFDRKI